MKRTANLPILLVVAFLTLSSTWAQRALARAWPPPQGFDLKQVALFKNGLGFFVAEVACPAGRTDFSVILPVAPAHGTLWIACDADVDLGSAVTKEVEFTEMLDAITIRELLEANQGRKVKLTLGDEEIAGVVTSVAQNREVPSADPYAPGDRTGPSESRRPWDSSQASLATIQTDSGVLCIDPRAVTRILFAEERMEPRFARPIKKTELNVHLNRPSAGKKLTLTFLAKGITWAPSYMVDITDEQQARLSAKAVIVNDACELKGVAVQLVTGFPHLQFSDVVSPMARKETLAQFLQALSQGESAQGHPGAMYNVMSQRASGYRGRGGPGGAAMPEYGAAELGMVAEDLFLYPAGDTDLGKGDVAYIPMFTESVSYEHVYQWDIPDYVDEQGRYDYNRGRQEDAEQEQEVWHSLRLTNSSQVPWTTAPGETVKQGVILGQDTLKYTPPGSDTTLRITRAVGVKADQTEFETDRERDAMQLYGYHYDLVTVRGDLSVLSTQSKDITVEITKTLSGEVKSTEPTARQEKLAKGLRRMNGLTKLIWTIELPAGTEKRLNYVYDVYVRR